MTAVPGSVTAALVVLALALLVPGGRHGAGRLLALQSTAPGPVDAVVPPALRSSWVVVGAVAAGALGWTVAGAAAGVVLGAAAGGAGALAVRRAAARSAPATEQDGDIAGGWELLAVCLEAGLPVSIAVAAAAEPLHGSTGAHLRRVAGLLELGADPVEAWFAAEDVPVLATFARAAGRSAGTGAALAQVARAEGARLRADLLDSAQARSQRAAVHITGPLGLCFLPAFLVLGIAPVVIGLAGEALAQW
ncbi:type II secretion system F family protein [Pseudonocardia xinjiangensis]|uniref:type II secretion system F family protein n=1 Tax=Pseudonocardia xinjiangensis TaxID=75289 RepID=UPI003D92A1D0